MKKVLLSISVIFSLAFSGAYAQTVKGTIADEGTNSVGVYGEPSAALNNVLFRNINITFSIADQGVNNPTNAQITLLSGVPNLDLVPVNTFGGNPYLPGNGRAYYSYIMSDNGLTTTSTWPSGSKDNLIARFTFPTNSYFSTMRMDDVSPDGGPNQQMYWYVEVIGPGDVTDYGTMFYGTPGLPPTNNGGASPSFVPLQPITVIPVKFISFTVSKSLNDALLKWEVTNEDANTDRYELERSYNAVDFVNFATIAKNNNSGSVKTYTATDAAIVTRVPSNIGIVYYRIKQIDKDGRFTYTDIRNIKLAGTKGFSANVFPNPVKDITTVNIDIPEAVSISILITDAGGKEVKRINMEGAAGGNTRQVNMSALASGTYMFKIKAGDENKVITVVKK